MLKAQHSFWESEKQDERLLSRNNHTQGKGGEEEEEEEVNKPEKQMQGIKRAASCLIAREARRKASRSESK